MTNSHKVVATFTVTSPSKWCCGNFSAANLIDIYSLWRDYWHLRLSWLQWDWIRYKLSATLSLKTSNSFSVHSFSCVWFIYWGCECCHVILCFGSGEIVQLEVVDGGLVCSSGVQLEDFGDKSDNCYVVNAAVYVGYWIPVQAIALLYFACWVLYSLQHWLLFFSQLTKLFIWNSGWISLSTTFVFSEGAS
jgi:hypothetical protein